MEDFVTSKILQQGMGVFPAVSVSACVFGKKVFHIPAPYGVGHEKGGLT